MYFFLNAVFAFADRRATTTVIEPAVTRARSSLTVGPGIGGPQLACASACPRWVLQFGWEQWFAVSLSMVIAVMMVYNSPGP